MEAVPFIRRGTGNDPSDGGCILQIVDWVSTGGWSDNPKCVHRHIQDVAIRYNDDADAQERQKLLDLIPRLRNTNVFDSVLDIRLEKAVERYNEQWFGPNWRFEPIQRTNTVTVGATWDLLIEMLDIVDQHLGRTEHEPIDLTDVCAVMTTTIR